MRAVVDEPLRSKFDHWYSTDHLPWAVRVFRCEKAWRLWSGADAGVHYAIYLFADRAQLDAALASEDFKEMVADFNRAWPEGVARTRDILDLVEERDAP
ncbi:MAG: hypothetical protein ACREDY_19460 [Bradyrhizobium sp.]